MRLLNRSKGFTLLELSLVMFIMSLTIGLPLFIGMTVKTKLSTNQTMAQTYQLVVMARQQAITTSQPSNVILADTGHTVSLYQANQPTYTAAVSTPVSYNQSVGFTYNGRTRRAGTVSVTDKPVLTVGVGYGRIRQLD